MCKMLTYHFRQVQAAGMHKLNVVPGRDQGYLSHHPCGCILALLHLKAVACNFAELSISLADVSA